MKKPATCGFVLLMLLVLATSAQAQTVLYGAAAGSNSPLYLIDPATGTATAIGNIGIGVGALAEHPVTGVLYGVTAPGFPATITSPRQLLRIDPATGAGTVIGSLGLLGFGGVGDLAFRSDGTLFGWALNTDDLATINLTTGAATIIGNAGLFTFGAGLEFDAAGTLYLTGSGGNGALRTVNTTTGLTTSVGNITGSPNPGLPIAALALLPGSNLFYAIQKTGFGSTSGSRLVTINPTTRVVTLIGPSVARLDALAFAVRRGTGLPPPSLSELIPASGSTLGGTLVTLRGSDFAREQQPQVFFDGIPGTNLVYESSSTMTVVTPPHAAGVVDVTVRHADGKSSTLRSGFTYVAPPPVPTTVTLSVQVRGHGNGRVVSAPAGIACGGDCTETYTNLAAVAVQLIGIPAADSTFAGWTGDADCADGAVTMTANRTCAARFERLSDGRPLDLNGDGRGDLVGYTPGAGVTGSPGAIERLQTHPGVLRAGDVNGDQRSDIIGYDPATGAWTIELGGASVLSGTADARQSPLAVDINGDGRAEVVFYDPVTGRVQPCLPAGSTLDCRATATVAPNGAIASLDLNGAGLGDLLVYSWETGAVSFLLATSAGTYNTTSQSLSLAPDQRVLVLDVNGDRRSDLIVTDPVGGATSLLVNIPGGFTTTQLGVLPGFRLHTANLDGDTRADLIAYHAGTGQALQAINTGSGFTVVSSQLPPGRQTMVTDLDGDRRSDLLLYDPASGAFTIAYSQATGTFTQQQGNGPPGLTILAQQSAP